jgi:predicted transcriptional regulator
MSSEESGATPDETFQQPLNLTDPKAMRALAHPVRMALLELLSVAGTVTATQASEALGESPANCAFHLRTLAKYGFVAEAGGGRGRERPWTLTRSSVRISTTEQTDAQAALAADALSQAWFEHWVDRVRRTYANNARMPGWEQASNMTNRALFLTAKEAEQVSREMREIIDRYQERQRDPSLRPDGALPVEIAFFTSPLTDFASPTHKSNQPRSKT